MKIAHVFTRSCVESEVLSQYGNVTAFGWKPYIYDTQKNTDEYIQCDLRLDFPVTEKYDFMLLHPPCKKFSLANNKSHTKYENYIPRAKEIAEKYADYWIIENVRSSPIGFSPDLRLKGDMFDLPIKYERVFWSNYEIEQPEIVNQNSYRYNVQKINKQKATELKGYAKDYHVHSIVRNSLPAVYVEYLISELP